MITGRVEEMAAFLVHTGMQPDTYWSLTLPERNAIIEVLNRKARS